MNNAFSFADTVNPIMADIGFDLARIRELSNDDLVTVWTAHHLANIAMGEQLAADLGDRDAADCVITRARRLSEKTQQERREQFARAVEANRKPKPRELAAHIALSLDITSALSIELQRRARASPTN